MKPTKGLINELKLVSDMKVGWPLIIARKQADAIDNDPRSLILTKKKIFQIKRNISGERPRQDNRIHQIHQRFSTCQMGDEGNRFIFQII